MPRSVLDVAMELINIESVSGNEKPMADWLETYFQSQGLNVLRQQVEPGRDNIYVVHSGHPRLIFNSHIDTVPPFFPARIDGDLLRGRGACDTKSLIAAQLLAGERLLSEGINSFGYLYVVGEEVDHCGMKKANELGLNPQYLLVAEPTESKLARRQKGVLKLALEAQGRAAHSGYPHLGESAIEMILDVLNDLRSHDWPEESELGETTLNLGLVSGGRAANVVPDRCSAEIMFRVVTSADEVLRQVRELVGERVKLRVIAGNDPTQLGEVEGFESSIVAFNTDIPYFNFSGQPLLWGAGSILDAHTDHECIRIADLEAAVETYVALARKLLRAT